MSCQAFRTGHLQPATVTELALSEHPRRLADAIVNFPRVLRLLDIHLRTFAGQAAASWK